ncbi:MAG: trmB [Ilumatobacteraceae bacterium]|nr:trmB [Ilumatobacteraceae bacterium]
MTDLTRPAARSFKPRRRGLSPPRAEAYAAASAAFGISVDGPVLSLPDEFGRAGPFVLDIGFGAGEALIAMARARPGECVVGVEVHTTGLAAVLEAITAESITNVRVVDGDVIELLARIAPVALDEVRMWFPDPWPKQRQRHRRLVRADVLGALVDKLRVGGHLHLATDVQDYSLQMQLVCAAEERLGGGVVERPAWRPTTRFERRGSVAGRGSVDLVYVRLR